MFKLVVRRLLYAIPMIIITTFIVFSFILLIPGDPALTILGDNATDETIALLNAELGLDRPIYIQYFEWISNALQGDLRKSIFTGQEVSEAVFGRLGITIQLVLYAVFIATVAGMFLAVISIFYHNTLIDYIARFISTLGTAIPNFWLALILVMVFTFTFTLFPATGFTSFFDSPLGFLKSATLPAVSLSSAGVAQITRQLRSSLIEVMESDYIRTAYSKGLRKMTVISSHAVQNGMLPVITSIGLLFGNMLGATVVVETIFAIPGIGQLAVNSILQRDFIMLQGVVLVMIFFAILINFIIDLLYSILDPRIELK
ncbi:ABC transporter permease [Kurthia sibirica]|uniref:Peptide ABC transporter n=1 Tax=Kurthia sibirica TaxID=202750 RepID=A0A2U3ALK5_9BACL|nr:ABC transporter permease [Kurthia sibirica]PWI25433.1 peptide ABC transporter [Kurthia sibirica]GEK34332.1 peptide ABC transporter permease [Kurthia sibirica]